MKEALSTVIREKVIPRVGSFQHIPIYLYSVEYLHKRCYRKSEHSGLHRCGGLTQVCHCLKTTLIKLSAQASSTSDCTRRREWFQHSLPPGTAPNGHSLFEISLQVLKAGEGHLHISVSLDLFVLFVGRNRSTFSIWHLCAPATTTFQSWAYRGACRKSKVPEGSPPLGSRLCPLQLDELLVSIYSAALKWEDSTMHFTILSQIMGHVMPVKWEADTTEVKLVGSRRLTSRLVLKDKIVSVTFNSSAILGNFLKLCSSVFPSVKSYLSPPGCCKA